MPTRLLDLKTSKQDGRAVLVNFPVSGTSPTVPYACLSYCWGTNVDGIIKTTKASLANHQQGIAISLLPKNFQDATLICTGLSIRYLWVDALCIIQDDKDDWNYESGQMCRVYSNSYITIAAHSADSCHQGFLGTQIRSQ